MTSSRSRLSNLQSPPRRNVPLLDTASAISEAWDRTRPPKHTGYLRDRETLKKVLARQLRVALDRNGWSLGEAAKAASRHLPEGWTLRRAHLSDYTRARHLPGPRYLVALAKALGVEPWELLEGEPTADATGEWRRRALSGERGDESVQVLDLGDDAWLHIRRRVPWPTAIEVLRMLQDERGTA